MKKLLLDASFPQSLTLHYTVWGILDDYTSDKTAKPSARLIHLLIIVCFYASLVCKNCWALLVPKEIELPIVSDWPILTVIHCPRNNQRNGKHEQIQIV